MFVDPTYEDQFEDLETTIRSGKSVAFVGSGLSMSQYMGWNKLIQTLCSKCGIEWDEDEDLLDLAEKAHNENAGSYFSVLANEFGKEVVAVPQIYTFLVNTELNGIVTINFDPLLAQAGRVNGVDIYDFKTGLDFSLLSNGTIFHIHGYVEESGQVEKGDLILCNTDFVEQYESELALIPPFLQMLFTFRPVVFIGCGLTERPLRKILDICARIREKAEKEHSVIAVTHYILLPTLFSESDVKGKKRDFDREILEDADFGSIGVKVVRYNRSTKDDHAPLKKIIEGWSNVANPEYRMAFEEKALSNE